MMFNKIAYVFVNQLSLATGYMIFNRIARIAVNQLMELPSSLEMEEPEPSIHRARNIYKCPVCAKTVKSQNYLRLHMKSHTGKQFTQNTCIKDRNTYNLVLHV